MIELVTVVTLLKMKELDSVDSVHGRKSILGTIDSSGEVMVSRITT